MKLISLLEKLEYTCLQGSTDQEVKNVIYDSRKVEEGSLFICIRGAVVDGHKFVPDVVAKGAKVLIVEEAVEAPEDVTVILVKDTRYAMAFISAAYFGYPAEKLKTIGITGTKGKTTTTYMVKSILENAGYKVFDVSGNIVYPTAVKPTQTPAANTSYKVQIDIANLNIRKGPGTNYGKTGQFTGKGIFTIVQESKGEGATLWGKLKSGAGWISLDFAKKI